MLKITESAASQIASQFRENNVQDMVLRVAAKTNQDGSFEYGMGFDEVKENDIKTSQHEIEIVMDQQSAELLEEATMDFAEVDDGGQKHFIFMNPLDPNYIPPPKSRKKTQ
jgi:iron-sulfur cluster assembly protein